MYRSLTKLLFAGVVAGFAALFLISAPTAAQTADGSTPAVETMCDGETGAAFGLCNAYCEAMDCDLGVDAQASDVACAKITARWTQIKGEGSLFPCDPLPPIAECPVGCLDILNLGLPLTCAGEVEPVCQTQNFGSGVIVTEITCTPGAGSFNFVQVTPGAGTEYFCQHNEPGGAATFVQITADEFAACQQAVLDLCP